MKDYKKIRGNLIHKTAIINDNVKLGTGNIIMPFAVIGDFGFIRDDVGFSGSVKIGDKNKIGCGVKIMAGTKGVTEIGNNNLIMNNVNIGHNSIIRNNCEIGANTIIPGYVTIGDNVKIKIGCTIRNRVTIGNNAFIAMGAVVVNDLPGGDSYMGVPAKPRKKQ